MKRDGWTLEQLVRRVASALAAIDPLRTAGEEPSARTIRYYTDLGVVDPPCARRGLHAMYGQRHFLQLLAIKRLQATGMPLSDIRAHLSCASMRRLEEIAKPGRPIRVAERGTLLDEKPEGARGVRAPVNDRLLEDSDHGLFVSRSGPASAAAQTSMQGFTLPGGIMVLLPASRPLTAGELESLQRAAAPLAMVAQRILSHPDRDTDTDQSNE